MVDDAKNQEPEDLLPQKAELEPGAERRRLNPERSESPEPEDLLDDPDKEMPPAEGAARPRNRIYPNIPPMPGAISS